MRRGFNVGPALRRGPSARSGSSARAGNPPMTKEASQNFPTRTTPGRKRKNVVAGACLKA